MPSKTRILALVVAVVLAVSGCAVGDDVGGARPDQAAEQVEDLLRTRYARWYAGIILDEPAGTMTVYSKPGSDLDVVVRNRFANVDIRFADARLSEQEMLVLTERVMADVEYWRSEGIAVSGAGPSPDGSAVLVMTADGAAGEAERLSDHYRKPIVVERGSAEFAPFSVGPDGIPSGPTSS
ncbi:hypothetical protein [Micromonospora sp. LOL_021]|uniref:hypothetical protein n=1 Tax=Micromonospora sp. LOL_021 TaxID=3345417 RepID=UPI003A8733C1